jgi:hypothetical protein
VTVILLYGRPPITDKNITWAEIFFLAPGIMLYLPILLLSGGVHWSILPFWARMPFWGTLNVLGYLAIPVVTQRIFRSWREWKKSGKQGSFWLELLRRPSVLVVVGVSCMLLGLNGILQIWREQTDQRISRMRCWVRWRQSVSGSLRTTSIGTAR